jgi:multiple sugar transport system ATP-binding protein
MASMKLANVFKRFGTHTAVNNVDLEVKDGEFLVLLGPSGCGKSTLLRMIAGLETLSEGEIHLGGRRVDQLPPGDRDMAFVFQSYALYPHMTVRRNIAFPLIMRQFKWWFHLPLIGDLAKRRIERSPEVSALVERTADMLALTKMLDRFPRTLSGGQRQRVALGRAMVRKPAAFLMDEPLSNLDAKLRTAMRSEITKLHQRVGGNFVYVTHDQIEAMTMGSKIALIRDGAVQQFGTPREIHSRPANTYVARFIGTPPMNIIHATLQNGQVGVGSTHLALPPALRPASSSRKVMLGIRPNAISLAHPSDPDAIAGIITLVEHVGAESIIAVKLKDAHTAHDEEGAGGDEVMVTVPGYTDYEAGATVGLRLDLSEASLFGDDGQRLKSSVPEKALQ